MRMEWPENLANNTSYCLPQHTWEQGQLNQLKIHGTPPPRKSIVSTIFVHLQVNFTHWRWIQSKYYSFSLELTFYLVSLLFRHQFRSMINETPRKKTSCSNFWNFSKISISHANLAIHTFTYLKWKGPL